MADWLPVNPYTRWNHDTQAQAWQEGADAMKHAIVQRYEALIDDPACESFRQALAQLKRELGLADG